MLHIYAFRENFSDMKLSETVVRPELFQQLCLRLPVLTLDVCRTCLMMPGACHLFTAARNDDTVGSVVKLDAPDLSPGHEAMLLAPAAVAQAVGSWNQIDETYKKAGGEFGPLRTLILDFLRVANQKGYSVLVVSHLSTMEYE